MEDTGVTLSIPTPSQLQEHVAEVLPGAHGHQVKALAVFVLAILERQTGNQADLTRELGNQEAALRRLSRLIHNPRLAPHQLAEAILAYALAQLPARGPVRLTIDWTSEGDQHLLIISLVIGGRAIPIFWRAYQASMLKGRMQRYELSVLQRVLTRLSRVVNLKRVLLTADRGFADVALIDLLETWQIAFILRVKSNIKVKYHGQWCRLGSLRFAGNTRRRRLGHVEYCASSPHRVWLSHCRVRNAKGEWEIWYLVSNRAYRAGQAAAEYGRRFACEEGFRDAKATLGFAQARIRDIHAWSRMFALFVIAMGVLVRLGLVLLTARNPQAQTLLRRVASRRCDRWDVSVFNAMLLLLKQDKSLFAFLSTHTILDLEARLVTVS
jgi:hypothetical protein